MLSQEKLLQMIDADLRLCDGANPADEHGKLQQIFEHGTLVLHREWVSEVGGDQTSLDQIVRSLEENMVVHYQRWREESTVQRSSES